MFLWYIVFIYRIFFISLQGVCRDILCHENRQTEKGICVYREQTKGDSHCYSIFLKLTPLNGMLSLSSISNYSLLHHILVQNIELFESMATEWQVYGELNASDMFDYIVAYIVVKTKIDVIQSFIKLDKTNLTAHTNSSGKFYIFHVNLGLYDIEHTDDDSFISLFDEWNFSYHILPHLYEIQGENTTCETGQKTVLNRLTLCPYVGIDIAEINVTINGDIVIINAGWANTTDDVKLTRWEYELHGDKIHLCLDTFIDIYNKVPSDERPKVNIAIGVDATQIVSFVCICLSLVCLVLTIFTYLRFTNLQSQPGMNTIILCCLLFLAQALFQFGAGQSSLPDWACALIGALCHFLWLSVMFAMNICSIHMFTIFKKHRKMLPRFRWHTTAKGIVYIVGFSLLCVILNIVISFTILNDNFGGYGGKVCYISSSTMQVITFLIPVAVTLTVNLLLFAYVVLRIFKTSSSANLNQERNYFLIYVRLSTLTGLTWIFGFLRLFLILDILEYIFIILNAGQGIFIMVAFVLNKRVLSMYFSKRKAAVSDQTVPSTVAIKSGDIKQ